MIVLQSPVQLTLSERILHADYWLLLKINGEWHAPWMDSLALLVRESTFHVPFYVFLALFIMINFGTRGAWWVVTALAMAGLSDLISAQLVKELIYRPRPCRDMVMANQIRFLARYCGENSSFVSSHASNHFAAATFIYMTLRDLSPKWILVFAWAGLIAYAQVYVGVHYPSDVICGALLGSLLGYWASVFFRHRLGLEPKTY
jgi:undecaprenyl-diphosphatase